MVKNIINRLHNLKFLEYIFHTINYCLKKELKDCDTVLDLGCGPSSPLQFCSNIKYSVGVEFFRPYLEQSKLKGIHTDYIEGKIQELFFKENSFDAVILIEILEHLSKEDGLEILKKVEKWAKKKIIISSPNGFIKQKVLDDNPLQRHLSGWDYYELKKMGYKSYGLAGAKFLRQEVQSNTMADDLTTSISWRPKIFWFGVAALSQLFVYFIPPLAFELFGIKKLNNNSYESKKN